MTASQRRPILAVAFWSVLALLVVADWVRGAPLHNRFDEPLPWALGSGSSSAAKGAHCTAAPRK